MTSPPSDVEILIVGAGPAGCAVALRLAELRPGANDVLVVEAAHHPRPKPCGGVIAPRAEPLISRWLPDRAALPTQPVRWLRLRRDGRECRRPLPRPALAVDRPTFDAALAAAVRRGGGALLEGHRLVGLRRQGASFQATLRTDRGEHRVRARHVVGADGAHSRVRRYAGVAPGHARAALALAARPVGRHDPPADAMVFEIPSSLPRPGYAWSFPAPRPDGTPWRNVGVYLPGGDTRAARTWLVRRLAAAGHATVPVRTAVQRLWEPLPFPGPGAPWLVGEARGADPITGEGIAWALSQGAAAAEALAGGALRPDEAHLSQAARFAPLVYGPASGWLAQRLLGAPALVDLVIGRFCGTPNPRARQWRALAQMLRGSLVSPDGLW